jgi:hypothetical protein
MLVNKVARTYLQVSDGYIIPAQEMVSSMLRFDHDGSPEGRRKCIGMNHQSPMKSEFSLASPQWIYMALKLHSRSKLATLRKRSPKLYRRISR